MNLEKFDGKLVRITDLNWDIFEWICSYLDNEYLDIEYWKNEEGLQIVNFLFCKSDIKNVEIIKKFSAPFGLIEEMNVKDGTTSIEDELFCEENEHIYRMLVRKKKNLLNLDCRGEVIEFLEELIKINDDKNIQEKAIELIKNEKNNNPTSNFILIFLYK